MRLTVLIHQWFAMVRRAIDGWFDFGCDLGDLEFGDEDVQQDLATGRE